MAGENATTHFVVDWPVHDRLDNVGYQIEHVSKTFVEINRRFHSELAVAEG